MSIEIEIKGLDKLLSKLGPELLSEPLRTFLVKGGAEMQKVAQHRSPVDTGRLRASLTYKMDGGRPPLWVRVGTNVTHRGVSYPSILEESGRHHYRAGPFAGSPTRGWFSGTLRQVVGKITRFVDQLGQDIAARFGA